MGLFRGNPKVEQVFPFPEGKFKYQFHSQISATHAVCKFHLMILLNYISFFYVYVAVNFLSQVIFYFSFV